MEVDHQEGPHLLVFPLSRLRRRRGWSRCLRGGRGARGGGGGRGGRGGRHTRCGFRETYHDFCPTLLPLHFSESVSIWCQSFPCQYHGRARVIKEVKGSLEDSEPFCQISNIILFSGSASSVSPSSSSGTGSEALMHASGCHLLIPQVWCLPALDISKIPNLKPFTHTPSHLFPRPQPPS